MAKQQPHFLSPDRFSIKKQGLLLIAIPLTFELIVFSILGFLLHEAELDAAREAKSRMVTENAGALGRCLTESASTLGIYYLTKDKKLKARYEKLQTMIAPTIARLKQLCADNEKQAATVERISRSADKTMQMLTKLRTSLEGGGALVGQLSMIEVRSEARACMTSLTEEINHLVEQENEKSSAIPVKQQEFRDNLKKCVLAGVFFSVLIAVSVATLFSRNVVLRLRRLSDNSIRLSKGQGLLPAMTGKDEIAGLDLVFHDMALALTAAHNALALDKTRLRSILDHVPMSLFVIDDEGHVEMFNTAAGETFGDNLEGTSVEQLLPHSLSLSEGKDELVPTVSAAGERLKMETRVASFETVDGPRRLVIAMDVTEKQKMLEMRKQFVAMISHDLRSPLTSLQILLESLIKGIYADQPELIMEKTKHGSRNVARLIDLTNDLLDLEKADSGLMELNLEITDLHFAIEQAIESVEPEAEKNNVSIVAPPCELAIMVDERRLVRVLVNLLSNAIKFSPKNSSIRVEYAEIDAILEVHIIDAGPGVPLDEQDLIFERYRQAKSTKSGGTGLGLANCKVIVEAHGGTIGVKNPPAGGADFWFRIPTGIGAVIKEKPVSLQQIEPTR